MPLTAKSEINCKEEVDNTISCNLLLLLPGILRRKNYIVIQCRRNLVFSGKIHVRMSPEIASAVIMRMSGGKMTIAPHYAMRAMLGEGTMSVFLFIVKLGM